MKFYGTWSMWANTTIEERTMYQSVVLFDSDEEFQEYLNGTLNELGTEDGASNHGE